MHISSLNYFTTEDTEDTEFFSLFLQVKQSDKYVRSCVTL